MDTGNKIQVVANVLDLAQLDVSAAPVGAFYIL